MHAKPDLRGLEMDDRWFRLGDHCRYPAWAHCVNEMQDSLIHPVIASALPLALIAVNLVVVAFVITSNVNLLALYLCAIVWLIFAPTWLLITSKQVLPFWSGLGCWVFTLAGGVGGVIGNIALFGSITAAC